MNTGVIKVKSSTIIMDVYNSGKDFELRDSVEDCVAAFQLYFINEDGNLETGEEFMTLTCVRYPTTFPEEQKLIQFLRDTILPGLEQSLVHNKLLQDFKKLSWLSKEWVEELPGYYLEDWESLS